MFGSRPKDGPVHARKRQVETAARRAQSGGFTFPLIDVTFVADFVPEFIFLLEKLFSSIVFVYNFSTTMIDSARIISYICVVRFQYPVLEQVFWFHNGIFFFVLSMATYLF